MRHDSFFWVRAGQVLRARGPGTSTLNYLARQLKIPSKTHTNFYVTKVGCISTTEYVLPKRTNLYVLPKRTHPM